MNTEYKICSQCIMDTTDPSIKFNEQGICDYCLNFAENIEPNWNNEAGDYKLLDAMSTSIRARGKGNEFDCIIGLSGGLDSSFVAYTAVKEMKLRPLLVHVDAGWNTDQAVSNIEKLVDGLNLELYTEVINWEAVKRMQLAFIKSGIPDQDLVQDAAFFSALYKFAKRFNVKDIITGSNFSTECCREPEEWGGYLGIDKKLFNDIWKKHGDQQSIKDFPIIDILVYKILYQKLLGYKVHHPLNLVRYKKKEAEKLLYSEFGWEPFQHKHHESRFTRFFEDFWLPRRFGFEKRRAHFSSLILTKQLTRDEAIKRISNPEMSDHFLTQEFEYVANKLGVSVSELEMFFDLPIQTYRSFKNKRNLISLGANILRLVGLERRFFR